MNSDFYVGYLPKAPEALAKWVRRIVITVFLGGLAVAALLILDQAPFAASRFEYGFYREYSGVIEEWPYPMLRTADKAYLLVAPGKHGFSEAGGLPGHSVHLKGALIERGSDHMLEVPSASLREISALPITPPTSPMALGSIRLRGEIVDSKCYLGVMKPGDGKVHRDCAVRCISGGAPPAFVARDALGETKVLLLVGSDGHALNREVLSFVAEPLEIDGEMVRSGSTLILKADPSRFRRDTE
jgi:hypothetical protein